MKAVLLPGWMWPTSLRASTLLQAVSADNKVMVKRFIKAE